jgi:hypothetical protein
MTLKQGTRRKSGGREGRYLRMDARASGGNLKDPVDNTPWVAYIYDFIIRDI